MPESRTCSGCGAGLSSDSPGGHCLACLLRLGFPQEPQGASPEGGLPVDPTEQPVQKENSNTASSLARAEKPGDRIGRYKLLQQIGEGGCGIVYMAEQEEPVRRLVALKIIKLGMDTRSVIARFEAERQALALMEHPNIAKVHDAGATETGRPFFVMELVRGVKLTSYCDQQKLSTSQRLELFLQVCQAVQHAHQKGIIHRDLKPSNILVTEQDGAPVPKIIDFGIAKATTEQRLTDKTLFTAFEQFLGTPAYMSPEQAGLGGLDIDTRSDIYSLGVLLYELLTGQPPFDTEKLARSALDEILRTVREVEPPRPSSRFTTLTQEELTTVAQRRQVASTKLPTLLRGDLDWIVMKCLEKNRGRRYETANGLARDIERHLGNEPVAARPPGRLYEFQKTVRRHKFGFAAAGAVMVALTLGLAMSTWESLKEGRARRRAVAAEAKANTEAAKSRQVSELFKDMLKGAGPEVASGRDATILREILDRTAERVIKELTNQPAVEVEILQTLGETYAVLAEYKKSEEMVREELRAAQAIPGGGRAEVAKALELLAATRTWVGPQEEAEKWARESLKIRRELFGNEHVEVAESLTTLAYAFMNQDKVTEAEGILREVLEMRRKLHGKEHREVAETLHHLALSVESQGRWAEAEDLERQALVMSRKMLGNLHPSVAESLHNLAHVLDQEGRLDKAEDLIREALAMERKLYGEEHPAVLRARVILAEALRDQGKLTEAEQEYREELALRRRLKGDWAPSEFSLCGALGDVLCRERKFGDAEELFNGVLTPAFVARPESGPWLAVRASILAREGKWRAAADDLIKVVGFEPGNYQHYHELAPLLVACGDLESYRFYRQQIIERFANATGVAAERSARDCLILSISSSDLSVVGRMAEAAVLDVSSTGYLAYAQCTKGLAEYREGHLESALNWMGNVIDIGHKRRSHTWDDCLNVYAYSVSAMAHYQLEQREKAHFDLSTAKAVADEVLLNLQSNDLNDWLHWILAHSLLDEAITLVEGTAPVGTFERRPGNAGNRASNEIANPQEALRLLTLTGTYLDSDENDKAEETGRKTLRVARSIPGGNNRLVVLALARQINVLEILGRFPEAEKACREALELGRECYGAESYEGAAILRDLAEVLEQEEKLTEAEDVYRQALGMYRKLRGDTTSWKAITLHPLALVIEKQGRLAEAENMLREALAMRREFFGNESDEVTVSLSNLAEVVEKQGRASEAENMLREALVIARKVHGDEQPLVVYTLNTLAVWLAKEGRRTEAADANREALVITRKLLTDGKPEAAALLSNLAGSLLDQGKLTEAEDLYREALAVRRKLLGDQHRDVADSLIDLGGVLERQKKLKEAADLYRGALTIRRKVYGNEHHDVAIAMCILAGVFSSEGKLPEAEDQYRDGLAVLLKSCGNDHPEVAVVKNNLALLLEREDKLPEAESLFQEALAVRRRLPGTEYTDVPYYLNNLAHVLQRHSKLSEAESAYRELLTIRRSVLGDGDRATADALGDLVNVLRLEKRFDAAEKVFNDMLTPSFTTQRKSAPILRARADFLARWGKWRAAADDMGKVVGFEPSNHVNFHMLVPLLVAARDLENYRHYCGQIVDRFRETTNSSIGDRMAKDCLALPGSGAELNVVGRMADVAVGAGPNNGAFAHFQCTKGLAEYRQGHFASALSWMARTIEMGEHRDNHAWDDYLAVHAYSVSAMAHYQLKQKPEAQAALAKATAIADEKLLKLESGDIGGGWRDWIIAHALVDEARAMIESGPETSNVTGGGR
jgi:tetratricopeptide (TPR) repeat protein